MARPPGAPTAVHWPQATAPAEALFLRSVLFRRLDMVSRPLAILALLGFASGSAAHAQSLVARLNAGGPALNDDLGQAWSADQAYAPGGGGYVGGVSQPILLSFQGIKIGGQGNPLRRVLFTGRVAWSAYRFDVPN